MQSASGDIRQRLIFLLEYISYKEVVVDGVEKDTSGLN